MLEFNNYFSNKTIVNQDIYSEEQRKLMNILLNEIKKAENVSQKNKPKLLKELNQERILNWFFKLNLEDKIKVSTITNKWLSHILLELSPLFKKENEMIFVPKKEMLMIFTGEIRNSYENNGIDNDKKLYEKYFICNNKMESKDNEAKIDNDLENKFLGKYLNIISSDSNTITLSEELLSDSKEFKRLFRFLSNDKFFTETLSPKKENKNFSLPSWMFKAMNNLTLSQIIIGFIEQNILLNYELFYYTKRIYQSITQNTIVEIYEEINNIDKQISNESFYFENIISQDKFEEATKNISINQESKIGMFNEIKNYIIESKSEEGKINKLLKKLTFLNFKEVNEDRISIYDSYKRFILDLIRSIIAKELIIEDTKILKSKTNNKKNKKKKGKKNKEIKENENDKKKEKEENEEKKQNKDINIGSQNVTNEEKKNEVNEKEVNEQKSKKIKNFILFPVNPIKKEKKKSKKKKQNKKSSKKVDINNTNNHINLNEELIRISSMTSISTYKSSNYQQDLSSNDDSSSISDLTPNEFTNLTNNNTIINNIINFIRKNNGSNEIDMNNRINNNNCNKIN
jgi:chemotaxis protein histidine kinase CheA